MVLFSRTFSLCFSVLRFPRSPNSNPGFKHMNRPLACVLSFITIAALSGCSLLNKKPAASDANKPATQTAPSPATIGPPAQPGELQPGQASGSYKAKGEVVELKYAYAGRAQRFGEESLVVLLTEKPIPDEAVAEEIKSTSLLEGEKLRGLEYVLDDKSMWVRFHPGQYQESTSNKLKDYKVENGIVKGTDENDGSLTDGKYSRSVKFVAAIK